MPYKSPQQRPGPTRMVTKGNQNKTGRGDGHVGANPLASGKGKSVTSTHHQRTINAPGRNESGTMPGPYNTRGYSNIKVPSSQQIKDATVAPDGTRRVKKG